MTDEREVYRTGDSFPVDPETRTKPVSLGPNAPWRDFIFVSLNSRVLALRRDNGAQVWLWRGSKTWVTLLLDQDRLIVGANGYVSCLDPNDGQLLWENPLKGMGLGMMGITGSSAGGLSKEGPAFADRIFLSVNKRVVALRREDGALLWDWSGGHSWTNIALDGDRLIAASNGYVTCLDPNDGATLWHNPLKGHGYGAMGITSLRSASDSVQQLQRHHQVAAQSGS